MCDLILLLDEKVVIALSILAKTVTGVLLVTMTLIVFGSLALRTVND